MLLSESFEEKYFCKSKMHMKETISKKRFLSLSLTQFEETLYRVNLP